MESNEIRKIFLNFFEKKQHLIVPSAPMVVKDDPTLMFTNAGMNQFKDYFLGNKIAKNQRIADTQKCLRVSGKHNDLEEVGHDTYHHTMFEMLGNWSFGNYFKKEAIQWAWELMTEVYGINKDNIYVTVFGGDVLDGIPMDQEAYDNWKNLIAEDRILLGNKKDNFWEMGDTGPCGPCSEIHVDIRDEEEKSKILGKDLVNTDNPLVLEIWNLVFIEFNRTSSGELKLLPEKHIDTGMGFERLCLVLQGVKSSYDTDIFQIIIQKIAGLSKLKYGENTKQDIAMRVVADHLRAVSFAIADGQLPSNNKAGYVIRRILRRAVRYGYTFLGFKEPFMFELVSVLVNQMGTQFPELEKQSNLIKKVIFEEEGSFLRTLETGIQLLDNVIDSVKSKNQTVVSGTTAFELNDTYGFPLDLTELILKENNLSLDRQEFDKAMKMQKDRSRQNAIQETDDWIVIYNQIEEDFVGYTQNETLSRIKKYRKVKQKDKVYYQLLFDKTPLYAESGGQVGDQGFIVCENKTIPIIDTKKENNITIHLVEELPDKIDAELLIKVDVLRRKETSNNHTATHLLHEALRTVLGNHVEQKGSLVNSDYLRFDFSHFQKLSDDDIITVEKLVNEKIRQNIRIEETKNASFVDAKNKGAITLFGEKYGDTVRIIQFGASIELCGGTHVNATGEIGIFKIISESAIAAGMRRIEAITGEKAEDFLRTQHDTLKKISQILKNPKDVVKGVTNLHDQRQQLQKHIDELNAKLAENIVDVLINTTEKIGEINFISAKLELDNATAKNLAFQLNKQVTNLFLVFGNEHEGKANITMLISDKLVSERGFNAGVLIREIAKEINGGGGGQSNFATAGGKNPEGINSALQKARLFLKDL